MTSKTSLIILTVIIALALVLRLPNLYSIPKWDWDEGYNLNYGWHISQGRVQWFSIRYTFIPHPPVYFLMLALLVKSVGYSLLGARVLNVAYSILTLVLVYLTALEASDRKTGLLAAFLYAIYPAAVYWCRTAMINNLLALLVMLSLYSFIRHIKHGGRWWAVACIAALLSSLTAYFCLVLVASLLFYFLVREPGRLFKASVLMLGPLVAFFIFMVLFRGWYFIDDLVFQLNRFELLGLKTWLMVLALFFFAVFFRRLKPFLFNVLEHEVSVLFDSRRYFDEVFVPSCLLAVNFILAYTLLKPFSDSSIFGGGDYFWLGIVGLLFIQEFRAYVVLLFFLPLFSATILMGRADHMLIQLYPFFAYGVAVLLVEFYRFMLRVVRSFSVPRAPLVVLVVLALPFAFTLYYDMLAFVYGSLLKAEDVSSALDVAAYVNSVADADDLVLTTSNLAGFMKPKAGLITQAFVYGGRGIAYYRANLSSDWFLSNTSVDNADYVVVPPGAMKWFAELGHQDIVDRVVSWSVVYRNRVYVVYEHPGLENESAPEYQPGPKHKE